MRARAAYRDFDETYERVQLTDGDFFMNLRDSYIHEAAAYQMARRRDKLVAHIQGLIDTYGEAARPRRTPSATRGPR